MKTRVGILLFDEIEVLDFAGPYEVLAAARDALGETLCEVLTLGEGREPIRARGGLRVIPDLALGEAGALDLLIVPGGPGARGAQRKNQALIAWLREAGEKVPLVASVCTGAFLLAESGLLDGRRATTHKHFIESLRSDYPALTVVEGQRYVDEGRVASSAGVSAGIDLALHIVDRMYGRDLALELARSLEYRGFE